MSHREGDGEQEKAASRVIESRPFLRRSTSVFEPMEALAPQTTDQQVQRIAMLRYLILTLSLITLGLPTGSAGAQCLGPDGLSGPCWTPTPAILPQFRRIDVEGTGICWKQCDAEPQLCIDVILGVPVMTACGRYTATLLVSDCSGNPLLSGEVVLDYTRCWFESKPGMPAETLEVYRLVAKADLALATPGVTSPCLIPACLPSEPTAFYYGYVDYAYNCDTGEIECAFVLFHNCDDFIHDTLFSSKGGDLPPGHVLRAGRAFDGGEPVRRLEPPGAGGAGRGGSRPQRPTLPGRAVHHGGSSHRR